MKIRFLQHEYTWSDHCITGSRLGWGITASSTPRSLAMLKELEKLAAEPEPCRTDDTVVEELIYSPAAGFVRLFLWPLEQGDDGRNNKYVRILQTADPGETRPEAYFAGAGRLLFKDPAVKGQENLPELTFTEYKSDPDEILKSAGLYDRLPDFLKVLFTSLMEGREGLNIVCPEWTGQELAEGAARIMYAVHCLLPEELRKKAGYRSPAGKGRGGIAFFFSQKPCAGKALILPGRIPVVRDPGSEDLSDIFYQGLAYYWKQDRDRYKKVLDEISAYLEFSSEEGRKLEKIQWIFCDTWLRERNTYFSPETIAANLPDLMYWSDREEIFRGIRDRCLERLHQEEENRELMDLYLDALLDKISGRSLESCCHELEFILKAGLKKDETEAGRILLKIQEKNLPVFKRIRTSLKGQEGWDKILEEPRFRTPCIRKEKKMDVSAAEREPESLKTGKMDPETQGFSTVEKSPDPETPGPGRKSRGADYRILPEEEEEKGGFAEFLLTALPVGFLTGCVMFLSHYTLMIGHWKIALGMGGMWFILILGYMTLLMCRQIKKPLWMGIGLCLLTGELIEIAASYFVPQKFWLMFFIIMGTLTAVIQIVGMIRVWRENK